jgi:hypothetical protein
VFQVRGDHGGFADADLAAPVAKKFGQIGRVIGRREIDHDRGVAGPKTADQSSHRIGGQGWQAAEVEMAGGQTGDGRHGGRADMHVTKSLAGQFQKHGASWGQSYAFAEPVEQIGPKLALEFF